MLHKIQPKKGAVKQRQPSQNPDSHDSTKAVEPKHAESAVNTSTTPCSATTFGPAARRYACARPLLPADCAPTPVLLPFPSTDAAAATALRSAAAAASASSSKSRAEEARQFFGLSINLSSWAAADGHADKAAATFFPGSLFGPITSVAGAVLGMQPAAAPPATTPEPPHQQPDSVDKQQQPLKQSGAAAAKQQGPGGKPPPMAASSLVADGPLTPKQQKQQQQQHKADSKKRKQQPKKRLPVVAAAPAYVPPGMVPMCEWRCVCVWLCTYLPRNAARDADRVQPL